MKAAVILTVLFACVALSQAAPKQSTQLLKSCSVSAFIDDIESIVADTFNFVNVVVKSYETAVVEGLKCAQDYDDFTTLVTCVGTAINDWTDILMPGIQDYLDALEEVSEDIAENIYSCV